MEKRIMLYDSSNKVYKETKWMNLIKLNKYTQRRIKASPKILAELDVPNWWSW